MEGKEVIIYKGSTGAWINGLLIGALVGAVAALLYSPKTGDENRRFLNDKTNELRDRAIEIVDDTRSKASHTYKRVRGQLQDVGEEATKQLKEEKQNVEDRIRRTYDL